MRQLLSGIGFIVLAVLGAYPAFAQKDIYSADYIMPGCRDFIGAVTGNTHLRVRGYCVDLVIGLARDAYAPRICLPREVTDEQIVRVVVLAYKDGGKSGGRKPGSKTKLTLATAQIRSEAMKTMNDALGADAFKGDGVDFLQAIYKNPKFDFDVRMEAATRASQFERAKKTESMIENKHEYVVAHMPTPVKDLDEWKQLYMQETPDSTSNAASAEKVPPDTREDRKKLKQQ